MFNFKHFPKIFLAALGIFLLASVPATAVSVKVVIENLAPNNGNFFTPVWVGFHNGSFDIYDSGFPAATFLERLAEDGNTIPISDLFSFLGDGSAQGIILGPTGPLAPGDKGSMTFNVDGNLPTSRYFSYASMVIPSNDAFIANGNPLAHEIFDGSGNFLGADFIVLGSQVLDAGTEVNDEIPANTAFFGQMVPNTGVTENGVVGLHSGFLPPGSGGILDDPQFANADFTAPGYQVARIQVVLAPLPSSFMLLGSSLAPIFFLRRRKKS